MRANDRADDEARLQRLAGEHPAAIRAVHWGPGTPKCLEIETKHGHVVVIDRRTGRVYSDPPRPPGVGARTRVWHDLTDFVNPAFDARPRIRAITRIPDPAGAQPLRGWRLDFSTGRHFEFFLDGADPLPSTSPPTHEPDDTGPA